MTINRAASLANAACCLLFAEGQKVTFPNVLALVRAGKLACPAGVSDVRLAAGVVSVFNIW